MHTAIKKTLITSFSFLFAAMVMHPLAALAAGDDWIGKNKITINTGESGAATQQVLPQGVVLVRLHSGNFLFADVKMDGSDIRFMAEDGKTPLKYQVEKFDPINDLALIWVQVPNLKPASGDGFFWMNYGNEKIGNGEDGKALFDVNQVAAFHFSEKEGAPQDQTAYGNHVSKFGATRNTGSLIGSGAAFDGAGGMTIPASPSLKFGGANGFTFSAWLKIAAPQQGALLFEQRDGAKRITVGIDKAKVFAAVDAGKGVIETPHTAELAPGGWHHVAVTGGKRLTVYVDGREAATVDTAMPDVQGDAVIGKGLNGEIDELGLSNVARTADWVKIAAKGQGPDATLLSMSESDEAESGGEASYLVSILHSVTLDGWVVIGLLVVMAAISWMVMATKALVLNKAEKDNEQFIAEFHALKVNETTRLDRNETDEDSDLQGSALGSALFGRHDHYQSSTLYRIYHTGAQELEHRFGKDAGAKRRLSPQAIGAIKASLDATLVRETQKLNSQMVLLTIAISGGPFLGLLGTVVGVMITFAAIAATGDVNVAAIAPGIAAALVATVAGLAVAIPALFGYNYLGSKIKNITADMHVFVDEFLGRIAESHGK